MLNVVVIYNLKSFVHLTLFALSILTFMFKIQAALLLSSILIVAIPCIAVESISSQYGHQIILNNLPSEVDSVGSFIFISFWFAAIFYIVDLIWCSIFGGQLHRLVFAGLIIYYITVSRDYGFFMGVFLYLTTFIQVSIIIGVNNFISMRLLGKFQFD